ncbi:MAG: FAD-dependent oxidoreductase [Shimia sp.]
MVDITTDVLIVGTGPAGSAMAALLASYGIENVAINRYRWLANTPRAHITNQRTMEVLRDLGPEVEGEAYMHATEKELMGENVFCTSLAGEELGRLAAWGTAPRSAAAHALASPCRMNDLPQTFMEPLLYKTACSRGTQGRMSTEYLSHEQDAEGVTTHVLDRLTGTELMIRSKFLVGCDGGNSKVAEHAGLPIEGKMGVAGSINLLFKADLSRYVAHRPSVLYWVMQPGSNVGGVGMGVVRMVRPWTEWLAIWGYNIQGERPELSDEEAKGIIRSLVGDEDLEPEITGVSYWTVNDAYAARMREGRVFIAGDAAHRHPPSNGLGSNTSIQDAFNLAWKLAHVLRGTAGMGLLDSYDAERQPIAKQIVSRANQSIGEYGPIFEALGMGEEVSQSKLERNLDAMVTNGPGAADTRAALRDAIAFKKYEFDAHGVEMNQRYASNAVISDGLPMAAIEDDCELYYAPTTCPGARLPHAWLYSADGIRASTLDLCGRGRWTLLTGIGGDAWRSAAQSIAQEFAVDVSFYLIGPRQPWRDHGGDWSDLRAIDDDGAILVRPDHHVAWRRATISAEPVAELRSVFARLLSSAADQASSSDVHREGAIA